MSNRLAETTSPYLQQHADNPVHWQPWDAAALQEARERRKPILLSIGYSACHWCHVMAHESFEDAATAALMNRLFVNIKVDREERPDLDKIYQTAHQLLTRRPGGWPLTVFLTPDDHTPFFAGTYFPKESRYGMPPFSQILTQVEAAFHQQADAIRRQNQSLQDALGRMTPASSPGQSLNGQPIQEATEQLAGTFDGRHGGFGPAPKFPHPETLNRLLRHWASGTLEERSRSRVLQMALHTLNRMALGGLYDQAGGGFCRYSTDQQWQIPHFEKMLYDNGPLLGLYADAHRVTDQPLLRGVAEGTAGWVMREMQSEEGGYFSSLDADSEGEEGRFYLWTPEQAQPLLSDQEYQTLAPFYGLDQGANFEGRWHLHNPGHAPQDDAQRALLKSGLEKLRQARSRRVRPGRDDKILTSWNALMIRGMAHAGRLLERADWIESAARALAFLRQTMWRNGRLLAAYKDGRAHLPAYLDDYAYLMDALLEMLQCRWRAADLEWAQGLAEVLLARFQDPEQGGFFFTADDHERLIHRPKPFTDDAIPAGNGIAALVLNRLGHLLGEPRYTDAAEATLRAAWKGLEDFPHAHCSLLDALEEALSPPEILIIRGRGEELDAWRRLATTPYAPNRVTLAIPDDADPPGLLADKKPGDGVLAYPCKGPQCLPPISEREGLQAYLSREG